RQRAARQHAPRHPAAVPALEPGGRRDQRPAQSLRRRQLPLPAGADRRQAAAAPLEAQPARHRRRARRGLRPALRG
nr:hypothetical protein [Tanacetum cinerariifolium]